MRKAIIAVSAVAAAVVAAMVPLSSASAAPGSPGALTVAVYGDAPYGTTPTDNAEFLATPAFIDSINADRSINFVAHVGDIHSGKQFCTQAYDESIANLWQAYQKPLVYTPGDNEWSDCHKAGEGGGTYDPTTGQIKFVKDPATGQPVDYAGGNPAANLDLVRSIFFPQPGRTLGTSMRVLSQAQLFDRAHPSDAKFVENVMFDRAGTLFVTLNLPGGSNNDSDIWYGAPTMSDAQAQDVAERTGADLRWLDRAFSQAEFDHDRAVVVLEQADMWDLDGNTAAHLAAYDPFIDSLAQHTTAFGKPVLLMNGDSHVYRSDNPLEPNALCTIEAAAGGAEQPCASAADAHPGYNVPNFHRIVVHGSTFPLEWLKLTITPGNHAPTGPNTFGPFSWQREIQQ
jgi:hypothetical protein